VPDAPNVTSINARLSKTSSLREYLREDILVLHMAHEKGSCNSVSQVYSDVLRRRIMRREDPDEQIAATV